MNHFINFILKRTEGGAAVDFIITLLLTFSQEIFFLKLVQSPWKDTQKSVWSVISKHATFGNEKFCKQKCDYEINSCAPSVRFKIKFIKWFTIRVWVLISDVADIRLFLGLPSPTFWSQIPVSYTHLTLPTILLV